jgi:predicted DNA-binding protein YlxM (UPF0122 family)
MLARKGRVGMLEKGVNISLLLDTYGPLLTERQCEIVSMYRNDDLSLGEISELTGITRQGVRDVLVRSEATLREMEEKTGIIARFLQVRRGLEEIEARVAEIEALNQRSLRSLRLAELTEDIKHTTAQLKE